MQELVGHTITRLYLSDDGEHYLKFVDSNEDELVYATEGDCCSETWFADLIGVDSLLQGGVITQCKATEDYKLCENEDDGRCRQEVDTFYGYDLYTNRGVCSVIFRNSSNGYYGGSCYLIKKDNPEYFGEKSVPSDVEFTQITSDYPT